jgi:spermidine synthase
VGFSLLLPFVFMIPSRSLHRPSVYALLYALFLAMSFASGGLTGLQFPLATDLHLRGLSGNQTGRGTVARTAGLLYASDLLGGYFGGLIGGVVLLPILGLKESCFILAMIKGSSLLLSLQRALRSLRGG